MKGRLTKSRIIGLIILILIILGLGGTLIYTQNQPKPVQTVTVNGFLGGEKTSLFDDPQFNEIALQQGLKVEYRKAGSLDMMTADRSNMDYLFPSSKVAVEYGKDKGVNTSRTDTVFNSPIVVYTHKQVADALVKTGYMSVENGVYRLDMAKTVEAMKTGKTWADMGWSQGYGAFRIDSTDPVKSNSGNMYAALIATVLNNGRPATTESVNRDGNTLKQIFGKSGWMEGSSEDAFNQFLTLGVGSKPMMVGYESQILDLAANHADQYKQVANDLIIAYPTPTVWSTHQLIALNSKGEKLLALLKTDTVQKLAWEKHGFRSANQLGTSSISRFHVVGTIDQITAVTELPDSKAMNQIITTLK